MDQNYNTAFDFSAQSMTQYEQQNGQVISNLRGVMDVKSGNVTINTLRQKIMDYFSYAIAYGQN